MSRQKNISLFLGAFLLVGGTWFVSYQYVKSKGPADLGTMEVTFSIEAKKNQIEKRFDEAVYLLNLNQKKDAAMVLRTLYLNDLLELRELARNHQPVPALSLEYEYGRVLYLLKRKIKPKAALEQVVELRKKLHELILLLPNGGVETLAEIAEDEYSETTQE